MWRACGKCGRIHPYSTPCHVGIPSTEEMKLRNTYKWRTKREEIKKASNYLCAICREKGIYNYRDIEVHHIIKLRDRKDLLLDNENLIALCTTHHRLADEGKIDADHLRELARRREGDNPPHSPRGEF